MSVWDMAQAWHRVSAKVEGQPYTLIWVAVAESFQEHRDRELWVRVMDRVVDRSWRPICPEVSGNQLI